MFGNHSLRGLLEEGTHEKSPKCLDGNLGDFGEFCKGLGLAGVVRINRQQDLEMQAGVAPRHSFPEPSGRLFPNP